MRSWIGVVALLTAASAQRPALQTVTFNRVFPNAGQIGLFIAASDGSRERPLLADPGVDYNAAWSPDGSWIVFTSERTGSADLFRVRPTGRELERLTDSPAYDDQAAFSPDGTRLVFVSSRGDGTADLCIMDLRTRRISRLTSGPGGDFRPAWSTDGTWIAFSSDRQSELPFARGRWEHLHLVDLYVVRPDGSALRRITEHGNFCGSPKWSADNRRLLAYCMTAEQTLANRRPAPESGSESRLVWIDVASGAMSNIEAGDGVKMNPSILPGGDIAYIRKDAAGGGAGIHSVSGGRGPRGDIRGASWSPDGRQVVFHRRLRAEIPAWTPASSRDSQYRLVMTAGQLASFNPAGDRYVTNRRPLGNRVGAELLVASAGGETLDVLYRDTTRNVLAPQWSPRGDKIVFGLGEFNAFFNGFNGLFLTPQDRVETGAQVAVVNADGSGFREVTAGPNNNGFPSFAPDGRRFVYRTFGAAGEGLRITDLDTGAVSTLTNDYDNFPLWSPRGDVIIFSRRIDDDYEIYSIRPDGASLRRLTRSRGNDAHMAWSPDGEYIAFASSRMGFKDEVTYTDAPQPYGELFVMRYDGTHVTQLTDNQWEDGAPAWQTKTARGAAQLMSTCSENSPERRGEMGCTIIETKVLPDAINEPLFWHIDGFDSLARARAAVGPASIAFEAGGTSWLMTIESDTTDHRGGTHVAGVGPLPLPRADRYAMLVQSAAFMPGMYSLVHHHSGVEAVYVLEGEACFETPDRGFTLRKGETLAIPANTPMRAVVAGSTPRRVLAVIVYDAAQPATMRMAEGQGPRLASCK